MTSQLADVRDFLARQRVAHLATATPTGDPYVVPVCFALVGSTVYSPIDHKPKQADPRALRRVRNILANPRAALVADAYDEDWTRLGFVLLQGAARLVDPAAAEHARALRELRAKYAQYVGMTLEDRPVLALDIQRVTAWGATR